MPTHIEKNSKQKVTHFLEMPFLLLPDTEMLTHFQMVYYL
jgi:hypothetical protein